MITEILFMQLQSNNMLRNKDKRMLEYVYRFYNHQVRSYTIIHLEVVIQIKLYV